MLIQHSLCEISGKEQLPLFHNWRKVNQRELAFRPEAWLVRVLKILWIQGRTQNTEKLSPGFMVRVLSRMWKPPVTYYFSRGRVKKRIIVQFQSKVPDACHSSASKICATISNTGANKVNVFILLGDTRRKPSIEVFSQKLREYTIFSIPSSKPRIRLWSVMYSWSVSF